MCSNPNIIVDGNWISLVRKGSCGTEVKPPGFKPSPSRQANIVANGDSAKTPEDDIWSNSHVHAELNTFRITDLSSPIEISVIGKRPRK